MILKRFKIYRSHIYIRRERSSDIDSNCIGCLYADFRISRCKYKELCKRSFSDNYVYQPIS